MNQIEIILDQQKYPLQLEDNATTQALLELLPLSLTMHDLNSNEKYAYLDQNLPANPYCPRHIKSGDIMLYGDNCLVIFYKNFDTEYSYTRIGHINNLANLGKANITAQFPLPDVK